MSKSPENHSLDSDTYQQSDKTAVRSTNQPKTGTKQQNGHVPNLVLSAKIENFSPSASSVEELRAKVPDVKVSNIIGNFQTIFSLIYTSLDVN